MTRTEKPKKLANAIKEYRGSREGKDGKWIRAPKPSELSRVIAWLARLSVSHSSEVIHRINHLAGPSDFYNFLREVERGEVQIH